MTIDEVEKCFKQAVELVKTETRNLSSELLSHSMVETLFLHLLQAESEVEKGKAQSA